MPRITGFVVAVMLVALSVTVVVTSVEGQRQPPATPDAVAQVQAPAVGVPKAPEPGAERFSAANAPASSSALDAQPEKGQATGFDFARDSFNAKRPMQTFDEIMKADVADKPKVMDAQRKLLEGRYNLTPKLDQSVTMSRGKPLPVGPTARLASGVSWEALPKLSADEIKRRGIFPYPPLPHPKHATGGQVFPQVQIRAFPRLGASTSTSTCPRRFCRSSRRRSFCSRGPSSATSRAARSSPSTTSTGCSRTW